ncbi:MAG TPA: M23 family metallopeptidase [Candidatus Binatia bacterium]
MALVVVGGGMSARAAAHATQDEPRAEDQLTPVLARVLATPAVVVQSDGVWRLPWELVLTNVTDVPITIESVEVLDPTRGDAVVTKLDGENLASRIGPPVRSTTLGPGQDTVMYLEASFPRREDVPKKLAHRIVATTKQPKPPLGERTVERVAPTDVITDAPLVVGPPLRGARWVAAASCCDSYHRRAVLPINGERRLAQRYAIDWMQLTEDDRLASGDPKRNESYPQFGAEAIAVADATVAHVQDGMPEGTPGAFPEGVTATTADGNAVVLDLGGGRYALYAHFQPGSIRVREGERVKRGQVLGLVGNSGNSDAPHLHFHVMDGPSPLGSNGVPYVIDAFEVTGRAVSQSSLDEELEKADQQVQVVPVEGEAQRRNELPVDLAVVTFPES